MSNRPVIVIPRAFVHGISHDPSSGPHLNKHGEEVEIEAWPLVPLEQALSSEWETDAHVLMYLLPGDAGNYQDPCPRVNVAALPWLRSVGREPCVVRVIVDCDTPGHVAWTEFPGAAKWWSAVLKTLSRPELAGAAWYHTRAGYRLWWELPRPIPASRWRPFAERFLAYLTAVGLSPDPLEDWGRLMRLPRVTRDGVLLDLPRSSGLPGTLRWEPGDLPPPLAADAPSSHAPARGTPRPEYTPPTDGEWAMLARRRVDKDLVETLRQSLPLAPPPEERRAGAKGRNQATLSAAAKISAAFGSIDPVLLYRYVAGSCRAQGEPSDDVLWDRCLYVVASGRPTASRTAPVLPRLPASSAATTSPAEKAAVIVEAPARPSPAAPAREIAEPVPDLPPDLEDGEELLPPDIGEISDDIAREVAADVSDAAWAGAVSRRLVLTDGDASRFYVFDERASRPGHEVYHGPVASAMLVPELERRAPTTAGLLRTEGGNPMGAPRILADSGWRVRHVELRAGRRETLYDPHTETLSVAAAPWRDLEPRRDPQIEQWLALVGGERLSSLLDWLATFRRLNRPTCALYLHAPKGLGKQLMIRGLARLFDSGQYVPYSVLEGDFHDDLQHSALVWADETIPRNNRGQTPSATFREVVGNDMRRVNPKGRAPVYLVGHLRVLITANNPNVFAMGDEEMEPDDVAAVIERLGYIRAGEEPGNYLASLGGKDVTEPWVEQNLLARHVLWLEAEREVKVGPRYLVAGWHSEMHDRMTQRAGSTQALLTALATALADRKQWSSSPGVLVKDGGVFVNQDELRKILPRLLPDSRPIPAHRLRQSLSMIARPFHGGEVGPRQGSHRVGAQVLSYWRVDAASVLRTAEQLQIGDQQAMRALIENSLKKS